MTKLSKILIWNSLWLIIWGIQLCKLFLIFNAGIIAVEKILYLSTAEFLLFSFIILSKYKKEVIFKGLFLFTFFFFLYNHIYSIVYFFIINIKIFDWFSNEDIFKALTLSAITFSILVHITIIDSKSVNGKRQIENIKLKYKNKLGRINALPLRNKIFLFIYAIFSILSIYYIFKYLSIPPDLRTNRLYVLKIIWGGLGIYIKIAMIGVSAFLFVLIYNTRPQINKKSTIRLIIKIIPFILFWGVHFLAGNRREFASLLIFVFLYLVIINKISYRKLMIGGIVLFAIMILISSLRGGANQDKKLLYLNSLGEFIIPFNTLIETTRKEKFGEEYKLGSTYLYPIYAMIPRAIWPDKPLTIASQFSKNMKAGFGLGFSPLTEAYMNWGKYAVFIMPLLILFLFKLFLMLDKSFPCIYIFLLMNTLNLNRGELGTVLLEIAIMYIPFYLLYYFSRQRNFNYS